MEVDRVHRAAVLEVEEGSRHREILEYPAGFEEMKIASLLYKIYSL